MDTGSVRDVLQTPGVDRILSVLSTRQRRLILLSVKNTTTTTETDLIPRGNRDPEEIEAQLIHNHLPKLEAAGYIDWDPETGEISKGPQFDEIEPLLELIENHADELPPDWP
jgi:hypothetical protein